MAIPAHLASAISCHAWNADKSMLAVCPNTEEVWIYTGCASTDSSTWTRKYVLAQHDLLVSGIDWHPVTNKIVTCSHDRNAFVWSFDAASDSWKPTVVVLGSNRAVLDVKWSPNGTKFAAATSGKNVIVSWYDASGNWWISKICKPDNKKTLSKSVVTSLAWHPNSQIVAAASTDYKVRIVCAYIEGVDTAPQDTSVLGGPHAFGLVMFEISQSRSWVNDVAWAPSGLQLAFVSHDGLLSFIRFAPGASAPPTVVSIKTTTLPANRVLFLSETALVTVGHNMSPALFVARLDGGWEFKQFLETKGAAGGVGGAAGSRMSTSFGTAKAIFAGKVTMGVSTPAATDAEAWTKHQGVVTYLQPYKTSAAGKSVSAISTSGVDGRVVIWPLAAIAGVDVAALGL